MKQVIISGFTIEEFEDRLISRLKNELRTPSNAKDNKEPEEFLTAKQVSKLLGVSLVSIHKWKKQGKLKFYRFGSRVRFKKSEILQVEKYKTKK